VGDEGSAKTHRHPKKNWSSWQKTKENWGGVKGCVKNSGAFQKDTQVGGAQAKEDEEMPKWDGGGNRVGEKKGTSLSFH